MQLTTGTSGHVLDKPTLLRGHISRKFPRSSHSISDISLVKKKSNCCSHETRFSEATCGFRRRDVVNNALYSGARKTPPCGCKPVGSYPHSYFCSCIMILWNFSILFIHHNPLDHFCPYVTLFWTNFQCCPCIALF